MNIKRGDVREENSLLLMVSKSQIQKKISMCQWWNWEMSLDLLVDVKVISSQQQQQKNCQKKFVKKVKKTHREHIPVLCTLYTL